MGKLFSWLPGLVFVLWASHTSAQIEVLIKIRNLPTDTVWFGRTWGKRAVPMFSATKGADGSARLRTDSVLQPGIYALLFKRGRHARFTYLSCLVTEETRVWTIETSVEKPYSHAIVSGNALTEAYLRYYDEFQTRLRVRDSLNDLWRLTQTTEAFESLTAFEQRMRSYQLRVRAAHAGTLLDSVVSWTLLPDGEAWNQNSFPLLERQRLREAAFHQALQHSIRQGNLLQKMSCPLWIEWLDLTVFKLYADPRQVAKLVDELLKSLQPHASVYQYYFTYMLNSFASMSRFSLDEVFLHMYNTYVKTGKASWLDAEQLERYATQAAFMPGTLVGDRARNALVLDRRGRKRPLDSLLGGPTLLVFWDPECGHCQKELPELRQVTPAFMDRGLRVISVCMAKGPRAAECWAFVDSLQLPSAWIHVREPDDEAHLSRLYNTRTIPRIYLIDENRIIVYRRAGEVPASELRIVLNRFFNS
ncbi:MAG: TlpA family protein disulfide reductase [Chitinophagales bacterium]|nr:TlpA family protein disulfide reductase [Chitinophagales bacterium]MDW8428628.1 TlpA disulfide reductase family protein [Chitinophagales bacterium]